jgi:flagellum-specific peptidoglycan hydrolase FlgJ
MCAQESRGKALPDKPTILAEAHKNLFGIKWNVWKDPEREWYSRVDMPANEFERAAGEVGEVAYRGYESMEHCIENWLWHLNDSRYYRPARTIGHREWVRQIAETWAEGNPRHAAEVVQLYDHYIEVSYKRGDE